MTTAQTSTNPFALMMEPEAVFAALARSDRLNRLSSRICRPLDNPLPARPAHDARLATDDEDNAEDRSEFVPN